MERATRCGSAQVAHCAVAARGSASRRDRIDILVGLRLPADVDILVILDLDSLQRRSRRPRLFNGR
jgi:hypothetical protein